MTCYKIQNVSLLTLRYVAKNNDSEETKKKDYYPYSRILLKVLLIISS